MQAKVQRTIELLKEFGYNLPQPHFKKMQGVKYLNELCVKAASDIFVCFISILRIKYISSHLAM